MEPPGRREQQAFNVVAYPSVAEADMEAISSVSEAWLGLSATKAEELTVAQVCLRAVVVYAILIGYVRIGKKTAPRPSVRVRRCPTNHNWLHSQ